MFVLCSYIGPDGGSRKLRFRRDRRPSGSSVRQRQDDGCENRRKVQRKLWEGITSWPTG
jgi:hypothetical protein